MSNHLESKYITRVYIMRCCSSFNQMKGTLLQSSGKRGKRFSKSAMDRFGRLSASLLVCLFSITAWLTVSAIIIQLPLLVAHLPEGWKLPSYIAIIVQLGNVAPILYGVLERYFPRKVGETKAIYFCIASNILTSLLLATTWSETVHIFGVDHSLSLMLLSFVAAMVACTSSVTFLPYMARFKEEYLTAFFFGKGLSGLLMGLLSLAQGVEGDSRKCLNATGNTINTTELHRNRYNRGEKDRVSKINFSAEVFFVIAMFINLIGLLSFVGLDKSSMVKRLMCAGKDDRKNRSRSSGSKKKVSFAVENPVVSKDEHKNIGLQNEAINMDDEFIKEYVIPYVVASPSDSKLENITEDEELETKRVRKVAVLQRPRFSFEKDTDGSDMRKLSTAVARKISQAADRFGSLVYEDVDKTLLSRSKVIVLMILQGWLSCQTHGIKSALLPYATLPYSNNAYHLAVTIAECTKPLSCLLYNRFSLKSPTGIIIAGGFSTALVGYIVLMASLSPCPLLMENRSGEIIIVSMVFSTYLIVRNSNE